MEPTGPVNAARTRRCLESIRSQRGTKAKVILLLGKQAVGKSSIAEHLTGVTGLSGHALDAGTERCQIVSTLINDTEYFIIDTPGLDDERGEWAIFCDIVDILEQIRGHAVISGVWYVVNNLMARADAAERRIYTWLAEFCGEDYFPHLTFVTTFWEAGSVKKQQQANARLERRIEQEWADFQGAHNYQFGKRYIDGVQTEEILPWDELTEDPSLEAQELSAQAREMVSLYCQGAPRAEPRILQQLNDNVPRDSTTAARVFRPAPPEMSHEEPSPSGTPPADTPPADTPAAGTRPAGTRPAGTRPAGTRPTDTPRAGQTDGQSYYWDGVYAFGRMARDTAGQLAGQALREAAPNLMQHGLQMLQGNNGGNQMVRNMQDMAQRGFDTNAVRDTFDYFGVPSDITSRGEHFYRFGGTGTYTGTAEQNDWLRRAMWRWSGR